MTWKLLGTRKDKPLKKNAILGYNRPGEGKAPKEAPKITLAELEHEGPTAKPESKERRKPKDRIGKQLQDMSLGETIGVAKLLARQCEEYRLHTRSRVKRVNAAIQRAEEKPLEQHGVAKMALAHLVRACCRRLEIDSLHLIQES